MARPRPVTERELVVAIDLGTSACKVVVFDRFGQRISYGRSPYSSLTDPSGGVEQAPRIWWGAVQNAIRISGVRRYGKRIVGYCVSSLRAAVLPVDTRGRPLANGILASDLRAEKEARGLAEQFGERYLYEKTGLRVSSYVSLARILWLNNNKPDIAARAAKLLGAQDYIIYKLTGRMVTDSAHASRTMCFNIHTKAWDTEIMGISGLSGELLPDIVNPGSVVGELHSAARRALDIPTAPVVACGGDQMCASVGLGGTIPGQVTINHGTGSFIEKSIAEPVLDEGGSSLCSIHVVPNRWIQEFPMLTTGRNLETLIKTLHGAKANFAALIDTALSDFRNHSQSDCLLFLPYQAGSTAPHWNPQLSGAIWGLRSHHSAREVVRAFFESIAFDLLRCVQKLKQWPREISVGGRLANLHKYNQLQADILGVPIIRTEEAEATALGSAVLGFVALGFHSTPENAVRAMVRRVRSSCCRPRGRKRAMYQRLFDAHERLLEMVLERSKGLR